MKLTTTLNLIRSKNPCNSNEKASRLYGWNCLIDYLGKDYPEDREINLLTILESNGIQDCLWALRCTIQDSEIISRRLAVEFARHVLSIFENKYPEDKRPRQAIETAERCVNNPSEENRKAAFIAAADVTRAAYAATDAADVARAAYAATEAARAADVTRAVYAATKATDVARAAYAAYAAKAAFTAATYAVEAAAGRDDNVVYSSNIKKEREFQKKVVLNFLND